MTVTGTPTRGAGSAADRRIVEVETWSGGGAVRIGELARQGGVSVTALRAWEHRYGILRPERTPGGQRVYGPRDLARLRLFLEHRRAGLAAAAAAAAVLASSDDAVAAAEVASLEERLWDAVEHLDTAALRAVSTEALGRLGIAGALDAVVVPALHRLGEDWGSSAQRILCERFATTLIRSLLVELLPTTARNGGTVLAFCPRGELHDLGAIMAAAALGEAGWRPVVLGANTPWPSVEVLLDELGVDAIAVGAEVRRYALGFIEHCEDCPVPLVLGGNGFREGDLAHLGAVVHHGPYGALPAVLARASQTPSRSRRGTRQWTPRTPFTAWETSKSAAAER